MLPYIQVTTTSEGSAIMATKTAGYENSVETIARKHEYGFEWTTNGGKVKDVEAAIEKGLVERNRQPRTVGGFINEYRLTTAGREFAIAQGWIAAPVIATAQPAVVTDDAQADSGDGDCDDALKCEHGVNVVYCTTCYTRHKQLSSTLEDTPMANSEPMSHEEAIDEVARLGRRVGVLINDCRSLYTAWDYQYSQAAKFSKELAAQQATIDAQAAEIAALRAQIKRLKKTADLDDGYIEFLEAKHED
jgi:cell division protein FtsB